MEFIHLAQSLVIQDHDQTYMIEASDIRYEQLVELINQEPFNEQAARDVLHLKFNSKITKAEIKDGQFLINGEIVPEPFSNYILSLRQKPDLFDFFYNLYFSLIKRGEEKELSIWKSLLQDREVLTPFSLKEEFVFVLNRNIPKNKYFKSVSTILTEKDLTDFVKEHFKKNVYKTFRAFIFDLPLVNWKSVQNNLTFLIQFKENDDKFFNEIKDIPKLAGGYQFLDHAPHRNELIDLLKSFNIKTLSHLKKFFDGEWTDLLSKLNQMHLYARTISEFNDLYRAEVFQDSSKLTFESFATIMNRKTEEWRAKFKDRYSRFYFNLELKHPWLLKLPTFTDPKWGECSFILPNQGIDLDIWSNTMNHCIRSYKESQANSDRMILLSIINTERCMLSSLELHVDYANARLEVRQFVGINNGQIKGQNLNFHETVEYLLKQGFSQSCGILPEEPSI